MGDLILKVTPEEVNNKASQIEQQKGLMDQQMQEMENEVRQMQEYWKSRSGEDYQQKFAQLGKQIHASLDSLMSHISNLKEAAQRYEQLETQQVSKVGGLSTDNIF